MKTLYISDLDGTLLNSRAQLKDRAAEMLGRMINNGVMFTYATARRFVTSGRLTGKIGIKLPVITMNGVMILDGKSGELIKLNGFEQDSVEEAKKIILEYGEAPLVYSFIEGQQRVSYLQDGIKRMKNFINDRKDDFTLRPCKSYEELFQGEIHYLTFVNPILPPEALSSAFSKEKGFCTNAQYDIYHKEDYWFEVFSKKASKSNAVLQLKEMLGADEAVCFGDGYNDISMFKVCDRSCCVSNGVDELKAAATYIIGSNEAISVPVFIEREQTPHFAYRYHETAIVEPDAARFAVAVENAKQRQANGIGTLNEKYIHAALKNYFADDFDHEAKIGSFYADIVSENGIYEIQTSNFGKLNKKLAVMLEACHVTVVYPYEKRVKTLSVSETSGELLREGIFRTVSSLTKLFLELYRIKSFLTNPNLTVCIAELDIERVNYVSEKTGKRRGRGRYTKLPLALRREIYLEKPEDYRIFLPDDLPERFSVKELQQLVKTTDARLMLEILGYMGITERIGKRGNADIYKVCK